MIAFSGVRISWEALLKNMVFCCTVCLDAASAF